jgi:spoIIIJ-associated protein
MRQVETTGRTVDEAIDRALGELGADRDDVEIEVVAAGSRGMLGLGAREAVVRVILKDRPAAVAHTLMVQMLRHMGFAGTVRVHEQNELIAVHVSGEHMGALIGRHGATLGALQFLLGLMVTRQTGAKVRVVVDVEGYRERRNLALEDLARRTAEQVVRSGREVVLDPMEAAERRIVHTTLADHPQVVTFSRGEGASRHVVVGLRTSAPVDAGPRDD